LVLLNKFNVMDHHILIVTREFELQEQLLTIADFQALALGLSAIDGLAFYNGGAIAGASQRHKHLQIVPLPFIPNGSWLPLDALMLEATATATAIVRYNPQLPYRHAIVHLHSLDFTQPLTLAAPLQAYYHQLLSALHLLNPPMTTDPVGAYNLLVTREWMCVVPRSQESLAGIAVNALGFAGALLVKTPEQLTHLQHIGPMTLLTEVGYAI
jgi:ATP adenylyltransferase